MCEINNIIMRHIDCVLYKTHTESVHKERHHRDGSRENVDHVRKLLIAITSGLMTDPLSLDEDDDEISPLIKIVTDVGLRMPFVLNERLVSTLRLALLGQITKFVEQRLNANNTPKSEDQDICFTGQEENGETGL